jgi:signal transduction histidine kinase
MGMSQPQAGDPGGSPADAGQAVRASALVEAGMLLASDLSLPHVLERLLELATRFTAARYGALGVLGPDGRIKDFLTVGLSAEQRAAIGDPPQGRGVLGLLISDPRPIRLERIQDHPASVGFPPNHPPMSSFLGAPVRARGKVFGNLYLADKADGAAFSADDEQLVVTLAGQAGVAIANAQTFSELTQRERWLQATHQTTTAMLAGGSIATLLEAIARVAREMTDSMLVAIVRPRADDPARLEVSTFDGVGAHRLEHLELPASGTASHAVIRSGRPRLVEPGGTQASWFRSAGVEVGPLMVVPLTVRQRTEGTILLARSPGATAFTAAELTLVDTFASQVALAIDYLRIQEQLQRLAVLQERQRIARDIHDDPVQALIYLARRLEALASPAAAGSTAEQLVEVRNIALAVSDGLRQLTEGLRSQTLDEHGLGPALVELGHNFQTRTGVVAQVGIDPAVGRYPAAVEQGLLRIAQESLSNVERHAGAGRVVVRLDRRGRRLRLSLRDDGIGFATSAGRARREGLGMLGMRERAHLLGGRVRLRSHPGRGSLVVVAVPIDERGDSSQQPRAIT